MAAPGAFWRSCERAAKRGRLQPAQAAGRGAARMGKARAGWFMTGRVKGLSRLSSSRSVTAHRLTPGQMVLGTYGAKLRPDPAERVDC